MGEGSKANPRPSDKQSDRSRSKKYGPLWSVEGGPWVYRRPYFQAKRWRVRRRHKATKEIEVITLVADPRSVKAAKFEVQDLAAKERQKADEAEKNGTPVEPTEAKLKTAIAEWLKTLDVRPSTHDGYKANAEMYGRLLGEERLVSSITFADCEKLFSETWKGSAGRTKIAHIQLLRRLLGWCVDHGYAKGNPAAKVKVQKSWTREASRAAHETGQALTLKEARALLKACRDKVEINFTPEALRTGDEKKSDISPPSYLADFVFISLRTGLRMSNILGSEHKRPLAWGDVDLKKGTLSIDEERMKNHEDFNVPIHAELLDWLNRRVKKLGRVPRVDEPIVAHDGELKRSFATALKRAGLGDRDFRVHDLRHSFVSWLGEHAPHAVMQVLAGHSAHSITDRYSKHQDIEKLREWLDKLEPVLSAGEKKVEKKRTSAK